MNAAQLQQWAAELAEQQAELARREAAVREREEKQESAMQQRQHQSGARRHRRSIGAAHDDGLRSAQESSSDGEVNEHEFDDVHRGNGTAAHHNDDNDDDDDDDDEDDEDDNTLGASTTVKLSELKKRHGVSLVSTDDAVLIPGRTEVLQSYRKPILHSFKRVDRSGCATLDTSVMYHASSVAASVARRMWCSLLIGSDGIDVDRAASARLRAEHRKEREDTLARRSLTASALSAKWNDSPGARQHRGSNQSSSSLSLTDDNSSEPGDNIWHPEHLVLVDRAADFDCTLILVIDGGAHMARDNGAARLFAALEALFDAVAPVASDSSSGSGHSSPTTPGKQVRRVVTLLLCRRSRCLQVAANLDVVADRALIKQAFDSIEFRGQANMAHGLELATQLVPQNMACFICVFNASPAPPDRAGGAALAQMQAMCSARYDSVTSSFTPLTVPSTRRLSSFDVEPIGGEKERTGQPPLVVFAFAFGDVADSSLLRVWCSRTGIGQFHWLPSADGLAGTVVASVKSALAIQAHSCVVRIIPEAGCRVWPSVAPYRSTLDNDRDTLVFIPTVFAGERHRLPFQLFVPAMPESGAAPTFVVNLTFVLVRDNNRKVSYSRRFAMPRQGVTAINSLESQFVHREVLRCLLADALQKALYAADGGNFDVAQSIVNVVAARMRASVDSDALLSNLTLSSSSPTTPTTIQHSASWSSLGGGRATALAPSTPVALAAGCLDDTDAVAAWLRYVVACAQQLFKQREHYQVARHAANAMLSALMLERVSHWRLPPSVFDAASMAELGPPPLDPYERVTAVQSPVVPAASRRSVSLPSGIIPLDASGNVMMGAGAIAATEAAITDDPLANRRRRRKRLPSSRAGESSDSVLGEGGEESVSPRSAPRSPRMSSSPQRVASSPRRVKAATTGSTTPTTPMTSDNSPTTAATAAQQ